jgi:hypothetical protein
MVNFRNKEFVKRAIALELDKIVSRKIEGEQTMTTTADDVWRLLACNRIVSKKLNI